MKPFAPFSPAAVIGPWALVIPIHSRHVNAWHKATPAASASSSASVRPCPSSAMTVRAICSLLARPAPTTACFTRNGAYSYTGLSRNAAAEIAAPRAAPRICAV